MSGVRDRVVVVTGAGRGLGRAYAHYLAAEGAKVVVNDIGVGLDGAAADRAVAETVVGEICERGGTAVASTSSVAESGTAQEIVSTALNAFGRIDGVVNNAGILRDSSFAKMTDEQWEAVMRTHLFGSYHLTRAAWPHFREQRHGRVVVATSSTGLFGNFGQANYGAAKLGVVGLIHTLAIEGAKYGIRANAISPMGLTRMTARPGLDEAEMERLSPQRVAPAVAYLCSDECTDTGYIIRGGGGRFQRVALMQSPGVAFDDVPDLKAFGAAWTAITDMDGATVGGAVGQI